MLDAALLMPKILARAGENAELTEVAAKIAWRRAVGDGLREHAVAFRLREGTLLVAVGDALWQKQLQAMSAELIFRVNKLLQHSVVQRIEFRIDPAAIRGSVAQRGPAAPSVTEELPSAIVSAASGIDDPELRERFLRAAGNCIDRRNTLKPAIDNR